jgi:acid phosphatase
MRFRLLLLSTLLSTGLAGCASSHPAPVAGPSAPTATTTPSTTAPPSPTAAPKPTKVLVVVEENHSDVDALAQMPYLAGLARTYGRTTAYRALAHQSLPNYVAILSGSTFGVDDYIDPRGSDVPGPSVLDLAIARGLTAKSYVDAMPSPCAQDVSGTYVVRHNPWAYFSGAAARANCRRFDLPLGSTAQGALRTDIDKGTLPNVGLLIPDLCHDAHDCPLSTADTWLRAWLTRVLRGPDYQAGRLAVVITFDENEGPDPNTVLTTVVTPSTRGVVSKSPYTHYSLARYLAELTGTKPLRAAGQARSLRDGFGL